MTGTPGEARCCTHVRFLSRVGHLQEIPLLGGEKAVYDVKRLVFAIKEALGQDGGYFTDVDSALLRKMMTKSPRTTSMGRVLDALSCYLGICQYRSYDGEPAMKLERYG
jgi:hydrogenase maturation protein HypF